MTATPRSRDSSAVVLVVDGWHAGLAGPWGNTWLPTPGLNRLAAESFVFDQAYLDSPRLGALCRSLWTGRHAQASEDGATPLPAQLSERSVPSLLLTDDPAVARHPLAQTFARRRLFSSPLPTRAAKTLADAHLARFFAGAIDQLAKFDPPGLAWIHTSSLRLVWDAPRELRNSLAEDEEDLPPRTISVPAERLPADVDPDVRLGWRRAYAGQIMVLDQCLAALREALAPRLEETLLIVAGGRGFPLGEHGWVGLGPGRPLHEELLHFPLLVRAPHNDDSRPGDQAGRAAELIQPPDVTATLRDWLGLTEDPTSDARSVLPLIEGGPVAWRDSIRAATRGGQAALRTADWFLLESSDAPPRLYVKPDDRWERNDVADRCADVVEELTRP